MTAIPIQDALRQGFQHHQAGRLQQAEMLYRQILQVEPDNADALHLLGLLAQQVGQAAVAIDLMLRAIALKPSIPYFHNNLGNAYRDAGRLEEAAAAYRRSTELDPRYPLGFSNLGNV